MLSYGASPLGSVFRNIREEEGIRTVHTALDLGINYIDVSPAYGSTRAESVLGRALKTIPRDAYYLATKVGQYGPEEFDYSTERVVRGVEESMQRLGVDYLDVIQCHDIEFIDLKIIRDETLPALHELKKQGKVGHVGITGLPLKVFTSVIDEAPAGTVDLILSFCRYALNDTALEDLLPYFKVRGIGLINASPLGMGLFGDRPLADWHPASPAMRETCRKAVDLCRERGWDCAGLAVQFAVAHPDIATTLVGTANPDNIRKNIAYAETPIDSEQLEAVLDVLKPIHNFNFTRGRPENRDRVFGDWTG